MCGIFGYYTFKEKSVSKKIMRGMGSSMHHRGPDHLGIYQDSRVGIGNTRLSIIDLKQGNQPMFSKDENIVLVQNGEIYNYKELKQSLLSSGVRFETNSDTEVLLKGIQYYKLNFLQKLNGMFAIATYNKKSNVMHLIRDRFGVKPLYYYYDNECLVFSSEIKALFIFNIKKKLEKNNINDYLKLGYLPKEKTLFKNIYQLLPGHYLEINPHGKKEHKWWEISTSMKSIETNSYQNTINATLENAINIRTRSDVPFGSFLSGGLDSSLVLYYVSSVLNKNIETFTISFNDTKFDELEKATKISNELQLNHNVGYFRKNDLKFWPFFIQQTDLPHSDLSFLPTYYLSQMASKKVKMVLSGDGADEFWGGYNRYFQFYEKYNENQHISVSSNFIENNFIFSQEEINKLLSFSFDNTLEEDISDTVNSIKESMDPINQILYLDSQYLLPGNNLIKIDRMAMTCSLEIRSPFMDYRLANLAFERSGKSKFEPYGVKSYLKKIAIDKLHRDIIEQKKQMFTVPISEWEGVTLSKIINKLQFKDRGLLNIDYITKMKSEHEKDRKLHIRKLRTLISLELWLNLIFDSNSCENLIDLCDTE